MKIPAVFSTAALSILQEKVRKQPKAVSTQCQNKLINSVWEQQSYMLILNNCTRILIVFWILGGFLMCQNIFVNSMNSYLINFCAYIKHCSIWNTFLGRFYAQSFWLFEIFRQSYYMTAYFFGSVCNWVLVITSWNNIITGWNISVF